MKPTQALPVVHQGLGLDNTKLDSGTGAQGRFDEDLFFELVVEDDGPRAFVSGANDERTRDEVRGARKGTLTRCACW